MTKAKKDNVVWNQSADDVGYEVEYIAEKTGVSRTQALALIQKHGNNRETLIREARKLIE